MPDITKDYELRLTPGVEGSIEISFEIARLLSVIADRLDTIAERLPMAGKGF